MPSFKLNIPPEAVASHVDGKEKIAVMQKAVLNDFNPSVLGLGEIKSDSVQKNAIAVIFDLQGFTNFCKQIEPQLSVPVFLSDFLNWLFVTIREETICKVYPKGVTLWHELPFFTKFMGDGILVLWDTSDMVPLTQHNLIQSCRAMQRAYREKFYPLISKKVSDAPPVMRCGLAKGTVYSVGNGEDFVGSCINMAARIQKLSAITFAFSRRGFSPEDFWQKSIASWPLKKVNIRGIGENELIYVPKQEFEKLSRADKKLFKEP